MAYRRVCNLRMMSTSIRDVIQTGKLHNNVDKSRFYITLNDKQIAEVRYEKVGNIYDLVNTKIPQMYHGQGLGTLLAERVFDHLVGKGHKLKLTCEFLQDFYLKNRSKYKDFVLE